MTLEHKSPNARYNVPTGSEPQGKEADVTITTKRAMTMVVSSAVAFSGAAACPAAPAEAAAPTVPAKAVVRSRHTRPGRHRPAPKPTPHRGEYVYTVIVGATSSRNESPNMRCAGSSIKLTGISTFPESNDASNLWGNGTAAWNRRYTVTASATTTITVPWTTPAESAEAEEHRGFIPNPKFLTGTAPASAVCAAEGPTTAIADVYEGLATWALPSPAKSVATLMATPPTNLDFNDLVLSFRIDPEGAVEGHGPVS